uniref:Cilia- and flagella-associated protein 418 n=1 Tax=Palpitomonas bilix TaxID=652834 RepID=A0A7S3CXR7_9EUKA|mmetsp:Transcript_13421/g.35202  ORF Transcript_13421/g.35202 Transcript_13421/m.35202 type:complete len:187 (+) Transcript_13421:187-747(+)
MADEDLDALIAEVEEGLDDSKGKPQQRSRKNLASSQSSHLGEDVIDSLLEELESPGQPPARTYTQSDSFSSLKGKSSSTSGGGGAQGSSSSSGFQIAGSSYNFTNGEKTPYHCIACDLAVIKFNDVVWNGKSDYMFFRNNYPEEQKLKKMFVKKSGWNGHCCQCKWEAVADGSKPKNVTDFQWVRG